MLDNNNLPNPPNDLLIGAALFLDFDGTLVELAPRPQDVIIPQNLTATLASLDARLTNRLAIVSGRSVDVLRHDFNIVDIAIAGSHGNEIAMKGDAAPTRSAQLGMLVSDLEEFASHHDGILIEPKTMGVGLHFRSAPDLEMICKATAHQLAEKYDLQVQAGKMLFEIYSGSEDKGSAIRKICAMEPFSGAKPIFIGDDKTDEHGFKAATELGGAGILVGPNRDTLARYRLNDVSAVHRWLSNAIKTL